MKILIIALVIAIIICLIVIFDLIHQIEEMNENNERYYKNLRRTYEIIEEELRKDIEVRDELLYAYTHKGVN